MLRLRLFVGLVLKIMNMLLTLSGDIETIGTTATAFFLIVGGLGVSIIGYGVFKRLILYVVDNDRYYEEYSSNRFDPDNYEAGDLTEEEEEYAREYYEDNRDRWI